MRRKLAPLILVALLVVTGCIYTRIMELKQQLAEFDKYFKLEKKRGLTMVFKQPVLTGDDLVWLMTTEPMSKKRYKEGVVWDYLLEKQYAPGASRDAENFDIPIMMLMRNDLLTEVSFPERFLTYLSMPLLAKMLSSIGNAQINKKSQRAESQFTTNDAMIIPTVDQFYKMLGKPYAGKEYSDGRLVVLYKYKLKVTNPNPSAKPMNNVLMRYTFQKGDKKLMKAEGTLRGIIMSLSFSATGDEQLP